MNRYDKLNDESKCRLEKMLNENEDLDLARKLKELFVRFRKSKNIQRVV